MAIYGNNIESVTESVLLETTGLSKEDLTDKQKVLSAIEKEKEPMSKLKLALSIIGILIAIVPITILLPIIIPVMLIVKSISKNIEKSRKKKADEKIIAEYEKQIAKLKKQLEKETDPEKRKEIEKLIKKFESELTEFKNNRDLKEYEEKIKGSIDYINRMVKYAQNGDMINSAEDLVDYAVFLYYFDLNSSQFNKYITNGNINEFKKKYYVDFDKEFGDDSYETGKALNDLIKNKMNGEFAVIKAIDDTLTGYNVDKKLFIHGDWDVKYIDFYSPEQLKAKAKDLYDRIDDIDNLIEADKYLGYYRLSKAPEGVEPKEIKSKYL